MDAWPWHLLADALGVAAVGSWCAAWVCRASRYLPPREVAIIVASLASIVIATGLASVDIWVIVGVFLPPPGPMLVPASEGIYGLATLLLASGWLFRGCCHRIVRLAGLPRRAHPVELGLATLVVCLLWAGCLMLLHVVHPEDLQVKPWVPTAFVGSGSTLLVYRAVLRSRAATLGNHVLPIPLAGGRDVIEARHAAANPDDSARWEVIRALLT